MRNHLATLFSLLSLMMPAVASGQTVTAMWDASPSTDQVTGYQVCIGTSSLSCNTRLASVGSSETSHVFTPVGGMRYYVAIRAINLLGVSPYSSEVSFSIPNFTQPANQSSTVGTAITPLSLSVSDPDGDPLNFTHTGLPLGLTLNSTTGVISGTPTTAGTYTVTVFVADDLVTVSRSLTWTVANGTPDTTAPALTISSHTPGQTVTTANVTISGTASDSGRGNGGVTSVRVNGAAATGGTATGSNTANWSRGITLVSGANTVTVEATDGAGNVNMQQFTLNANLPIAPVTSATLTANLSSPRTTGTAVTFTATGSGGVGPREFKFLVSQNGGAAQTVRDWSTTTTYTWTPTTAASYTITVWARSAGVTTDAAQASAQMAYVINVPPVTSVTLSANPVSPQNTGTAITFTAAASGGVGPQQYKFLVAQGSGAPQVARDWSTIATYNWTPTIAAGYTISVWARSAGVTADAAQASAQMAYTVNTPPAPSPVVTAVSAMPSSGSGSSQTFALQYGDSTGAGNLKTAWAWFSASFGSDSTNSCMIYYDQSSRTLRLLDDGSRVWLPATIGTSGTLENGQCSVDVAASSAAVNGTILSVNLAMTFKSGYAGGKNVYLFANNAAGATSNWQDRGDWTIPSSGSQTSPTPGVTADAVTPSSGSGTAQTFALRYSNSSGATGFSTVWVWFNSTFGANSANSCMLYYDRQTDRLSLLDDSSSVWMRGILGSGTLQNNQCSVSLSGSSVALSGTTLTLNLAMTFKAPYIGAKNIYLYGANTSGLNSGWHDRGDWTVPGSPSTSGVQAVSATPSNGSGTAQVFSLQYSDSSGASNLATTWVWFNASFGSDSTRSCMAYYNRSTGRLYMLDDGFTWLSGVLGTSGVLQNSQCAVSLAGSSVAVSGELLTLNLAMTFKSTYSGTKNIYMFANNTSAVKSGWQSRGSWIVP